jgi:sarcosine oxidase
MNADVIVIGLGAMGSAAVYQLARRGASVIGIDRYSPPHGLGSTHGETRITRQAIGEGEQFVPFALRSYEIWRELESETGADLFTVTGGLIMSGASGEHALHGNADFIETTINAAVKFGIEHRVLDARQIADEFPQFILAGDERGYFENEAGFLRPEECVETQLALARKHGARLMLNERVTRIDETSAGVSVVTDKGTYSAAKAIISAGPWVNELVSGLPAGLFRIYRQVLYWFDVSGAYENYAVGKFPIFIWHFGRWQDDYFYGFPAIGGRTGGLKIATEEFASTTSPDAVEREVSADESAAIFRNYVRGHLDSVGETCVRSAVCLYTVTPNSNFVIDGLSENILLASPCSGHGFKHSAAIGETLAELALTGKSTIDVSPFALSRFE